MDSQGLDTTTSVDEVSEVTVRLATVRDGASLARSLCLSTHSLHICYVSKMILFTIQRD